MLFGNFLSQKVLQSTRGNNILDLLLSKYSDMVCDIKIGELTSDHNIITFNVNINPKSKIFQKRVL